MVETSTGGSGAVSSSGGSLHLVISDEPFGCFDLPSMQSNQLFEAGEVTSTPPRQG